MIYGYARVSTAGHALYGNSLEVQEKELREQGCGEVFLEKFTGTKKHRPELEKLLAVVGAGDTVVVMKLDRLARSTKDGIEIIETIINKGASLNIVNMGKFDNTPSGKLMRTVMLAFAEFERDMIVQRTTEGKEIAKLREDFHEGRPKIEVPDFPKFFEKQKDGIMSVQECCNELGISRSKWYRLVSGM